MTLQQIYARLPTIKCQQKCTQSCGVIPLYPAEELVLLPKTPAAAVIPGVGLFDKKTGTCPHLNILGKCNVHQERPIICRIWGLVKRMECPHGCIPSRWLTDAEAHRIMDEVEALSTR